MIRLTDMALIAVAVGGAIWTYQIKHEAELSAKRLNDLRAQIQAQNDKIVLLEADWAIFTSPDYLEPIAKRYETQLGLKQMESTQIVTARELPPVRLKPVQEEMIAEGEGIDTTLTGGIGTTPGKKLPRPKWRPIRRAGGASR